MRRWVSRSAKNSHAVVRPAQTVSFIAAEGSCPRAWDLLNDPDKERVRRAMEALLKMGELDIAALWRAADGVPAG